MYLFEGKYIDLFATYRFLRILTIPWEEQEAFKLGIIDSDGKRIKDKKLVSSKDKDSYTMLHRLVFNFKRILSKIPLVKSKIGTYAAALFFLKEHMDPEEYNILIESLEPSGLSDDIINTITELNTTKALCLLKDETMIKEDLPANNMGDGNIADKDNVIKFDGRSKKFKNVMRRIKERKIKEQERKLKAKLLKMGIKEELVEKAGYEEFFKNAMKKFKIKDLNDLSDKEKDKFFTYIDKNWDAENESFKEFEKSIELDEKSKLHPDIVAINKEIDDFLEKNKHHRYLPRKEADKLDKLVKKQKQIWRDVGGDMDDYLRMMTDSVEFEEGAYELYDPKHPKFTANYKGWKRKNPTGKLSDFIAHMKTKNFKVANLDN